jgi:hypothetical protein
MKNCDFLPVTENFIYILQKILLSSAFDTSCQEISLPSPGKPSSSSVEES